MHYISIPKSSETCIIVPSDKDGNLFEEGHYKQEYLYGLMEQKEFDKSVMKF